MKNIQINSKKKKNLFGKERIIFVKGCKQKKISNDLWFVSEVISCPLCV